MCFVFLSLFRKAVSHQAGEVVILLFSLSSRTKFDVGKSLLSVLKVALTMFTKGHLHTALPRVRIQIPTQKVHTAQCSSKFIDLGKLCRPVFSHGSKAATRQS